MPSPRILALAQAYRENRIRYFAVNKICTGRFFGG